MRNPIIDGFKIGSAPELMAQARKIAGVDIADDAALEPLQVLVRAFNEDSRLHEIGSRRLEAKMLRILANRLRMIRDFASHPEIHEQTIAGPIFVTGSLRTGSTKMLRLLTASGDFNWLPLWKTMNSASYSGVPGEDLSARLEDTDDYVADFFASSPKAMLTHEQGTHVAEEEAYIFMQALRCPGYMAWGNIPQYMQWLAAQDMTPAYEYLRDTLKYLQWQGLAEAGKPWFLKCPFHCGMEDILRKVFPHAHSIVTHRLPAELMASMCSMVSSYIEGHSDHTSVDGHGLVMGFAASLERHVAYRAANPDFPVLDVHFTEAVQKVEEVIRRVYAFVDMPLGIESLNRMLAWNTGNPMHRHGAHQYTLADVGLTEAEINAQCPNYLSFYAQRFG